MASPYHVNPRIRAYGKARIDVTRRARDEEEWQQLWHKPLNHFPFKLNDGWKFCFEYLVDDYAAEVGFFIDILGFEVQAFSPSYARFSIPAGEFGFSVAACHEGQECTHPDSIRLQVHVEDILSAVKILESRGVTLEAPLAHLQDGTSVLSGYFRSPHGVRIELIGERSTPRRVEQHPSVVDSVVDQRQSLLDEFLSLPDEDLEDDPVLEMEEPIAGSLHDDVGVPDHLVDNDDLLEPEYIDEVEEDELDPITPVQVPMELKAKPQPPDPSPSLARRPQKTDLPPHSIPKANRRSPLNTSQPGVSGSAYRSNKRHGQLVYDEQDPG